MLTAYRLHAHAIFTLPPLFIVLQTLPLEDMFACYEWLVKIHVAIIEGDAHSIRNPHPSRCSIFIFCSKRNVEVVATLLLELFFSGSYGVGCGGGGSWGWPIRVLYSITVRPDMVGASQDQNTSFDAHFYRPIEFDLKRSQWFHLLPVDLVPGTFVRSINTTSSTIMQEYYYCSGRLVGASSGGGLCVAENSFISFTQVPGTVPGTR